ncbi:MAG TPA: GTP-binding protein, partial [Acetobacteraceae bacterium]
MPASILRVLTCGSVDDGKSTLIGRLLYECGRIPDDVQRALERDSSRYGTVPGGIDYALLVDGLAAEREQGITIDVAYRYFETPQRRFILADTPGHEQYTRNMVTGASTADLAVLLVDARKGLLVQTRRHAAIAALLGIRRAVLAVNKMDLMDYDEAVFERIATAFSRFAGRLGGMEFTAIPVCAVAGDNVIARSARMPWYTGPSVLAALEQGEPRPAPADGPVRMQVQYVNRPNLDFRGFAGTIAAGTIRPGSRITNVLSRTSAQVTRIVTMDGDLEEAHAGQPVTLVLDSEIDISRGDMLAATPTPDTADEI